MEAEKPAPPAVKNSPANQKQSKDPSREVVSETPCSWQISEGQLQPPAKRSRFHNFTISFYHELFKKRDLKPDSGKKIMCLFDPRDPECLKVATEIGRIARNQEIPPVFCIFNFDSRDHMAFDFFKQAKCNFPTTVTDSVGLCAYLDKGCKVPAVFYLWNGNVMAVFGGPSGKPFTAEALKRACCDPYMASGKK